MPPKFVYRAFHDTESAGVNSRNGFKSALLKSDDVQHDSITLNEHANQLNCNPTPWISTTDQLLRAILRAVSKSKDHGIDGVYIAVINVKACKSYPPIQASQIRYDHRLRYQPYHIHEFLWRWEIPAFAIVSVLPLQVLKDRGMFTEVPQALSIMGVDDCLDMISEDWLKTRNPSKYLQQVGVKAALFALMFGQGVHTRHVGLEVAEWWEGRVGMKGWEKERLSQFFFGSFNDMIGCSTSNGCFEPVEI